MRKVTRAAAALALVTLGGCSSPSELMIAVHTDLAVPEDIEIITVEVEGAFVKSYTNLGSEDAEARLPFTLGIVAEVPGVKVTVRASGWGADGMPRILREAVTTVPRERVALLHLPLQFLCNDSALPVASTPDNLAGVANKHCGAGETCVAGACVAAEVDSASLPDYAPEDVFGGGSGQGGSACFDVMNCFAKLHKVEHLKSDCSFKLPDSVLMQDSVNIALETSPQGALRGICDDDRQRCLVALDKGGEAGFERDGGVVKLPPAVCDQKESGTVVNVVWAQVDLGQDCPQKVLALPTCGPGSVAGGG
ncbi:hypothetical protein [Sorangium sp. So ce1078]|uniref:hypothetical protein n=1 Tax=Sorangium sp. So ce1078 TaxID=3133329 RepID=UPI003F62B248